MSNVSAYKWACISYGDTIPHYTCQFSHCKLCLDDKGYSTDFGHCNKARPCTFGPANNDTTAPVLTINSPNNNLVYNSSKVLFNLTTNEPSTIYYETNNDSNGKFKMLAGNRLIYSNPISFKDGFYSIIIRAEDRAGNDADVPRSFYVDTKKPKVDSPKFGDGVLSFKFQEANPTKLTIKCGNNITGYNPITVALNSCNKTNDKYTCGISLINSQYSNIIKSYDGQSIECWIEINDISGNIGQSKKTKFNIDLTSPVINNPQTMIQASGKYALFNVSVTEANLAGVYYKDNSTTAPKFQILCSSLKNGLCQKKISMNKGTHLIIVQALDKSGNFVNEGKTITIN